MQTARTANGRFVVPRRAKDVACREVPLTSGQPSPPDAESDSEHDESHDPDSATDARRQPASVGASQQSASDDSDCEPHARRQPATNMRPSQQSAADESDESDCGSDAPRQSPPVKLSRLASRQPPPSSDTSDSDTDERLEEVYSQLSQGLLHDVQVRQTRVAHCTVTVHLPVSLTCVVHRSPSTRSRCSGVRRALT